MGNKSIEKGLVEFGMGVVSYLVLDTIAGEVKRLEKEGKLNKQEGEKMMRDAISKYQTTKSKYEKNIQSHVDNLVKASPFATKEDIASLNAKIDRLSMLSKKVKRTKVKSSSKRSSRKGRK